LYNRSRPRNYTCIQTLLFGSAFPLERARDATRPLDYGRAAAMVAAATGVDVALRPLIGLNSTDLVYLVPVIAAALLYGLRPGLLAGFLSALAYNFFFLPPLYTFTIADLQNAVTVVVLLGVAVTSQLAARVRAQGALAATSARQNAALAGFARALAAAPDEVALGQALAGETAALFDARAVYLTRRDGALAIVAAVPPEDTLDAVARAAADWAFDRANRRGAGPTRCRRRTGCSSPSSPAARRARCSASGATIAAIRLAPTSAGSTPPSSIRPASPSPGSSPSVRWRGSLRLSNATGCARRCWPA